MKFIVSGGPRRKDEEKETIEPSLSSLPPPPAKYMMESRLSKSPEGQQVLESLSTAQQQQRQQRGGYDKNRTQTSTAAPSSTIHRANTGVFSQQPESPGRDTVATGRSSVDRNGAQQPQKESFFRRMAACTSPVNSCNSPARSQNQSQSHPDDTSTGDDGSQVPMAHLQFLRTNPTIARVTNAASRRYPAFCGRPDTIYEEPDDDDDHMTRDSPSRASPGRTRERSVSSNYRQEQSRQPSYILNTRTQRSDASTASRSTYDGTYDGSRTAVTYSTYGGTKQSLTPGTRDGSHTVETYSTYDGTRQTYTPNSGGSVGSGTTGGDNTAFLDKLAIKSAVASKPVRPRSNDNAVHKLGKASYGGGGSGGPHLRGENEVGWPDEDGGGDVSTRDEQRQPYEKDTIDNVSTYSSSVHSSNSHRRKKDTAIQAELLAAAKVEDMMNELHNVDPDDQCEI